MKLIKIFAMALLLSVSHAVFALESDADQPVHIDSNTASYNDKTTISTYTGDVVTVQGSLNIKSDKLVVYIKDGEIEKMIFTGKPAKFKQLPSVGADMIYGEGLTGEYYPGENKLILIEQAVLSQGAKQSKSQLIVYDSNNSLIKAGEKSSGDSRVHIVIQPKGKDQKNSVDTIVSRGCSPSLDEGQNDEKIKCKNVEQLIND